MYFTIYYFTLKIIMYKVKESNTNLADGHISNLPKIFIKYL